MLNNNSSESSVSLLAKSVINLLAKSFHTDGVRKALMWLSQWTLHQQPLQILS